MFKDSVISTKKKLDFERKQRVNVLKLRNKFLGEWASNILGYKHKDSKNYINNIIRKDLTKFNSKTVIKNIEEDFIKNDIKISYREIEFKIKEFQIKATVIIENKLKLDNWK